MSRVKMSAAFLVVSTLALAACPRDPGGDDVHGMDEGAPPAEDDMGSSGSEDMEAESMDMRPPPEPGLEVDAIEPADGTEQVAPDASITLSFDREVSRQRMRASLVHGECRGPIRLRDVASGRCQGARTEQVDAQTLRVTPVHPLSLGRTYAVEVVPPHALAEDGTTVAERVESIFTVESGGAAYSHTIEIDGEDDFTEDEQLGATDAKGVALSWDADRIYVGITGEDMTRTNLVAYVVVGARHHADSPGGAHVPAGRWFEGSTTLLPFHASHVFMVKSVEGAPEAHAREWSGVAWGARRDASGQVQAQLGAEFTELSIDRAALGEGVRQLDVLVYLKNLGSDCGGQCEPGWGWTFGATDPTFEPGYGDRILSRYRRADLEGPGPPAELELRRRFGSERTRHRIYQLLVRTFGNTNEARVPNGTREQNGVGTFEDLNDEAAQALADMGMTHVWMTGVLQQATSTDWSEIGEPADDPDILKGLAGSPYAIRDYFDVAPDYAEGPSRRLESFRAAIERMHDHDLRVIIDFVPNHVARSYRSTIHPELTFGPGDDTGAFYAPDNHFFYLQQGEPPVQMPGFDRGADQPLSPTCQVLLEAGDEGYQCDGLFDWEGQGEMAFGRVTGNNVASWTPDLNSWYETVKLNYGFDYTTGQVDHPHDGAPDLEIPRTWLVMDAIIAHWQALGVDGFRADMVHMVPMAFQSWLISRSRARDPDVFWMAEAYDSDPAKVTQGNVLHALLGAGYDAVYDDATYDQLKEVFDGSAWANDLDAILLGDAVLRHHSLRYAENHDEVRLCSRHDWQFGGQNVGCTIGPAVTALLHGLGRGPVMVYAGQETGEPAAEPEGFGGDDGRTTIFDYWSMPTFTGWVNGHAYDGGGLDEPTQTLRQRHLAIWEAMQGPLFEDGELWLLNGANVEHAPFGRTGEEGASGRHAHAFLRYEQGRAALVYVWLHPEQPLQGASVLLPEEAWQAVGLGEQATLEVRLGAAPAEATIDAGAASTSGVPLGDVAPGEVRVLILE